MNSGETARTHQEYARWLMPKNSMSSSHGLAIFKFSAGLLSDSDSSSSNWLTMAWYTRGINAVVASVSLANFPRTNAPSSKVIPINLRSP